MSFPPADFIPYSQYLAPPLVGAFIGYLTNKVAIRMLFRPLKPWYICGFRVPMTPGVIPAGRRRLAQNMGEVVGDHLLTSREIGKALQEKRFQQHLLNVISERVGDILHRDLPPLPELIPDKFAMYRDLWVRTLKQQFRDNVHKYIHGTEFASNIENVVDDNIEHLLQLKVGAVFGGREREAAYRCLESVIPGMLAGQAMAEWLDGFVRQQVYETLLQRKSLRQILPASLMEFLGSSIRTQTPNLLKKLAAILKDPAVRDGIVSGACGGVQNFILSLGPMAPMVQNFLSMEMVEQKIRAYLDEKEEDIAAWFSSEEMQEKVATILAERFEHFSSTPLVAVLGTADAEKVEHFCSQLSKQLTLLLQGKEVSAAITAMIKDNIETYLDSGNVSIGKALTEVLGQDGVDSTRGWIKTEGVRLLRSPDTLKSLDTMIDSMVDGLLARRIGRLSAVLPSDVRKEIYISIQKLTANMLAQEVPGLVDSLDIRTIVARKLDSLDLLRLEGLLLSIMEEQFKYINLFGALLGFLLGCGNLLFLNF